MNNLETLYWLSRRKSRGLSTRLETLSFGEDTTRQTSRAVSSVGTSGRSVTMGYTDFSVSRYFFVTEGERRTVNGRYYATWVEFCILGISCRPVAEG